MIFFPATNATTPVPSSSPPKIPSRMARHIAFSVQAEHVYELLRPIRNRVSNAPITITTQFQFLLKFFERFGSGAKNNQLAHCVDSLIQSPQTNQMEASSKAVAEVFTPATKLISGVYEIDLNKVQLAFIQNSFSRNLNACVLVLQGLNERLFINLGEILPLELISIVGEYAKDGEMFDRLFKSTATIQRLSSLLPFTPNEAIVEAGKNWQCSTDSHEEVESLTKSYGEQFCLNGMWEEIDNKNENEKKDVVAFNRNMQVTAAQVAIDEVASATTK